METEPTALQLAVAQFQTGEFYHCHDTLEALWVDATEPDRSFYQGLLQVAVACYHLGNQNQRGAMILLGEGIRRLRSYQPDHLAVDVSILIASSAVLLTQLQSGVDESIDGSILELTLPILRFQSPTLCGGIP
jgi:predicted metal-dependent hydrolase